MKTKSLDDKARAIRAHMAAKQVMQKDIAQRLGLTDAAVSKALNPKFLHGICDKIIKVYGVKS